MSVGRVMAMLGKGSVVRIEVWKTRETSLELLLTSVALLLARLLLHHATGLRSLSLPQMGTVRG